jgi:ankyrin repeat protein
MSAAEKGQSKMAELLVGHGANTEWKSSENRTALAYAQRGGHKDVTDVLQQARPAATSGSATKPKASR